MTQKEFNRRAALAKLGIAATVAYTAPTVLKLDTSANAKVKPSTCHGNIVPRGRCKPKPNKGPKPKGKKD